MYKGVFTAIVTPFKKDGSVDYKSLSQLIENNLDNGVNGIVPCGTTGESPTLSHEEHDEVIEFTVNYVNKRVPVIAGTGSNSTAEAIRLTQHAQKVGVDAALVVNPYYNKPSQEGLYRHFKAVADSVDIPIVLYNIKGRTGVNLETSTLLRIIEDCNNVRCVKEASGDLDQIKEVIDKTPDDFYVLSGDDGITLDLIKYGGHGVVSVASNVIPRIMSRLVYYALNGDYEIAERINSEWENFFKIEFIETNPIPIKAMLAMQGKIQEIYRLPLCELSKENKEVLKDYMVKKRLI